MEYAAGCVSVELVERELRRFQVLEITEAIAWRASRIDRQLRSEHIGDNVVWIAATALAYGLPVVTNNHKHLGRARGRDIKAGAGGLTRFFEPHVEAGKTLFPGHDLGRVLEINSSCAQTRGETRWAGVALGGMDRWSTSASVALAERVSPLAHAEFISRTRPDSTMR